MLVVGLFCNDAAFVQDRHGRSRISDRLGVWRSDNDLMMAGMGTCCVMDNGLVLDESQRQAQ